MSRFDCKCGKLITDTSVPAAHEAQIMLLTDVASYNADILSDDVPPNRGVMECPSCGRLWIESKPNSGRRLSFLPETERLNIIDEGGGYRG